MNGTRFTADHVFQRPSEELRCYRSRDSLKLLVIDKTLAPVIDYWPDILGLVVRVMRLVRMLREEESAAY